MQQFLGELGAVSLSMSTDKSFYKVGDKPVYTIIGAKPGSKIYWTSFKDGRHTGEENAWYGQTVDANGTAQLEGGAFAEADAGRWQKQLLIIDPDDTHTLAEVFFTVQSAAAATPTPTPTPQPLPASSGGALDFLTNTFSIGGIDIPYWAPIGAIALFAISRKR